MESLNAVRELLVEHLDPQGDITPPWAKFPDYERGTIGWRMGLGETWLGLWWSFIRAFGDDRAAKVALLKRHPPAPYSWADSVMEALDPGWEDGLDDDGGDDDLGPLAIPEAEWRYLLDAGLVASDVAYRTWRTQNPEPEGPWRWTRFPEQAARYWTRSFAFWSRALAEERTRLDWSPPRLPFGWWGCRRPLRSGALDKIDLQLGLYTLARALCAGEVTPPWRLGAVRLPRFRGHVVMPLGQAALPQPRSQPG
ncbi:MAG: hypothetical protein H6730_13005 [Deltaproteobacteria bacterium]|nr:hypothetical protein [Deltaproteobacteria bacterium]